MNIYNSNSGNFYIKYNYLEILVDKEVIAQYDYFNKLLDYNRYQNIYFDMENSLDLTEALDELLQDLYGQYNIKEAEKSLNVILNIINNNDIDIFNSNNNIEMLINMLDYFKLPFITNKKLQKFIAY